MNPPDTAPAMAAASAASGRHLAAFAPDGSGFAVLTSAPNAHGLTDEQIAICKQTGCDPATFARLSGQVSQ